MTKLPTAVLGVIAAWLPAVGPASAAPSDDTRRILEESGVKGGLIVHVGCGDGKLTAAMRVNSSFIVQGLDADVTEARKTIRTAGMYGPVTAGQWKADRLPYADNLVNLLVFSGNASAVTSSEILRVLAPSGVAMALHPQIKVLCRKPRPATIGEWTHFLHGPDNNAVVPDELVGPPNAVQWLDGPEWAKSHAGHQPSYQSLVSAKGRLFLYMDLSTPGVNVPSRWALRAKDAFNGVDLWELPIAEWGEDAWGKTGWWMPPEPMKHKLVAVGDVLYASLGYNKPLVALDAASGKVLRTYQQTEYASEWLCQDGLLAAAVNAEAVRPDNNANLPPVQQRIRLFDAATGAMRWQSDWFVPSSIVRPSESAHRVGHLNLAAGAAQLFLADQKNIICLDLPTGKLQWSCERPDPKWRQDFEQIKHYTAQFPNLFTLVSQPGVVLYAQADPSPDDAGFEKGKWSGGWSRNSTAMTLMALDSATGRKLWQGRYGTWSWYNPPDVFVINNAVWVAETGSANFLALDLKTGKELKRIDYRIGSTHSITHARCYRNVATTNYLVLGMGGATLVDVHTGAVDIQPWLRSTCHSGFRVCNGLLYATPHACGCFQEIIGRGFQALRSGDGGAPSVPPANRLEHGPSWDSQPKDDSTGQEWPAYRHDAARSGGGPAAPGLQARGLARAWTTRLPGPLTSLTTGGAMVFAGCKDAEQVVALDQQTGKKRWTAELEGALDSPPTYDRGRLLVGTHRGWVYCLRADTGQLIWRFLAADKDNLIMAGQRVESSWPVHGPVLIHNDVAYVVAGRSSSLDSGLFFYGLDPRTGEVRSQGRLASPKTEQKPEPGYRAGREAHQASVHTAVADALLVHNGSIWMHHLSMVLKGRNITLQSVGDQIPGIRTIKTLYASGGLLDDSQYPRTYWTYERKVNGRLLVFNEKAVFNATDPGFSLLNFGGSRRAGVDFQITRFDRSTWKASWTATVPIDIRAMVLAGDVLLAAGPHTAKQKAVLAEGGKTPTQTGMLYWLATATGKELGSCSLASPPVWDGMAVANSRLYVSLSDGSVVCYETP